MFIIFVLFVLKIFSCIVYVVYSFSRKKAFLSFIWFHSSEPQGGVPPPTLPRPSFQPKARLIVDDQRNVDGDLADKGTAIVGPNVLKPQAA